MADYDNSHVWEVNKVLTAAQMTQVSDNIDWLHTIVTGGVANPGAPDAGDIYFRSDLGMWIYYDGTRWLTISEYALRLQDQSLASTATGQDYMARSDYAPYITRVALQSNPGATNNGANYWTVAVYSGHSTGSYTKVHEFTTAGDTPNVYTVHEGIPSETQEPANYGGLFTTCTKTSSPTNLQLYGGIVYCRLIIT